MRRKQRRSETGHFEGLAIDPYWFFDEDESWRNQRVKDVRFPVHKEDMNGEVITYHIKDLIKMK